MHKCAEYVIYFYLMKAAVIGHVSIDLIESRGNRHISLGGAPIYSGKILSETGIRVKAITKIGIDDVLKFKGFFEKNSKATFIERILQQFFMIFSSFGSEDGVFVFIGKKIN